MHSFFSVSAETEGSGALQNHAEDHQAGTGRVRQEVPDRLGQRRVQTEQKRQQSGKDQIHPSIGYKLYENMWLITSEWGWGRI